MRLDSQLLVIGCFRCYIFPKVSHLMSMLFQHEEISNNKKIMPMKYIVQEKEVGQLGRLLRR